MRKNIPSEIAPNTSPFGAISCKTDEVHLFNLYISDRTSTLATRTSTHMNPKQEILQVLFDACVFTGNFSELGRRLGYVNNGRSTIGRVRSGHRNLKEKTLDELFEKLHEEYLISPDDMATLADSIAYGKDLYRQLREAYGTGNDWHNAALNAILTEDFHSLPGFDEKLSTGLKEMKLQEPDIYYGMLSWFCIQCKEISPYTNIGKKSLGKKLEALNKLLVESFPGSIRSYESAKKTIDTALADDNLTILKLIYNIRVIIRWYADDTYFENFLREMGHLLAVDNDSFWIIPGETFHTGCEMWYLSVIPTKSHKRGAYIAMKLRAMSACTDSFELIEAYNFMFLIDENYDNIHILQASDLPTGKTEYAQYRYNDDSRLLELNFDDVPEQTFNLPQELVCINHTAPKGKDEKVWARIIEKLLEGRCSEMLFAAINSSADSNIEYLDDCDITNICIDRHNVTLTIESNDNKKDMYRIGIDTYPFLKSLTPFEFASVVRYKETEKRAVCWNKLGQCIPLDEFSEIQADSANHA